MAESLGLKGWVRNVDDDKVEAVFEGPEEKVNEMIEWCVKGPPAATVENIETEYSEYTGEFDGFNRRN